MRRILSASVIFFFSVAFITPAFSAAVPQGFADIIKQNTKSIVNISTTQIVRQKSQRLLPFFQDPHDFGGGEREFSRQSLGSGFIISSDGYIITNNHVIEAADEITVVLWDETEYKASIKGRDPKTDIALIKIDSEKSLPAVRLGDSDRLSIGDWVVAVGNPYGLGHTVTAGIVSAKSRVIGSGPYDDFIQTDAAINPGNSGGPLFNVKGEVVGINSAIIPMAQGIGFAIPVNLAKEITSSLKTKGYVERGWLGVTVQKVTPEIAESLRLSTKEGALVTEVVKDSPADKANIKRRDMIIEFAGEKVTERNLPRLVASMPIGKQVSVKVIRDRKIVDLTVTISRLEDGIPEELLTGRLGIKTKTLNPDIAAQFGITDGGGGVLVVEVVQRNIRAADSLLSRDIIVEANKTRINSTEELAIIIREMKPGEKLLILLKRGSGYLYRTVKIIDSQDSTR